jgi:hypothetical protein
MSRLCQRLGNSSLWPTIAGWGGGVASSPSGFPRNLINLGQMGRGSSDIIFLIPWRGGWGVERGGGGKRIIVLIFGFANHEAHYLNQPVRESEGRGSDRRRKR